MIAYQKIANIDLVSINFTFNSQFKLTLCKQSAFPKK